jgi:hypothetical protein
MLSPREPVLPELSSGPRTARSTLPAPRGSVAGAHLLPEILHGLGVQKTSPEGAGCGVAVELLFVHCPPTSRRSEAFGLHPRGAAPRARRLGPERLPERSAAAARSSTRGRSPWPILRLRACFFPLPYESQCRRWASDHESPGSPCSDSPGASRQPKSSSPPGARGDRSRSQPKISRIRPRYHESKGSSDAANSRSARSGVQPGPSASRQTTATPPPERLGASQTNSAEMPSLRLDRAYSPWRGPESSCTNLRQGSSRSAGTSQARTKVLPAIAGTTDRHPQSPLSGAHTRNP